MADTTDAELDALKRETEVAELRARKKAALDVLRGNDEKRQSEIEARRVNRRKERRVRDDAELGRWRKGMGME